MLDYLTVNLINPLTPGLEVGQVGSQGQLTNPQTPVQEVVGQDGNPHFSDLQLQTNHSILFKKVMILELTVILNHHKEIPTTVI